MKAIFEVETLQICTTNACVLECANCTHLVGHHKKPYMMTMEEFRKVVDSLEGFPNMIGLIGGEPLLVPWFDEQCAYLRSKFPREQLGLWSVFPEGEKFSRHRVDIARTFKHILLNDHATANIMHAPMLVASGEFFEDKADLYAAAWSCWVANSWSPGVTPKGAFFCEVAAELDQLFQGPGGWEIEPGWWKRTPKDYTDQIERYCTKCGGCMPLARRSSQDNRCDISEGNAELLKGKSRKVDLGKTVVHKKGEFKFDQELIKNNGYPDQSPYKDMAYRQRIAAKYDMYLTMNEQGYWEPHLKEDGGYVPLPPPPPERESLFNFID